MINRVRRTTVADLFFTILGSVFNKNRTLPFDNILLIMHFTKATGVTLAVLSGLMSLGDASPLTIEVSVDIENMSEEVVGHGASLKKYAI
ncbi:hypothetical protein IFR05_005855 [Cadophora sp. M221]|nr:hypothetical protein IFR05_005855 [Cadophora sp. M221]